MKRPYLLLLLSLAQQASALDIQASYHLGEDSPQTNNRPFDSSGHGHHFSADLGGGSVVISTASPAPGSTACYVFSGSNQGFYDTLYNAPEDNVGIQAWVKTGDLTQGGRTIFSTGGNNGGLQLIYDGATGFRAALASRTYVGGTYAPSSTSEWVHLALVRDNGVTTFYVDGTALGNTATDTPIDGTMMHLAVNSGAGAFFKGSIDEVQVFTFAAGTFQPAALGWFSNPQANAPRFLAQPAACTVQQGQTGRFTASATGSPAPAYQWYHGTTLIPGATTATLDIPDVSSADLGNYHVTATNTLGTVPSNEATLALSAYTEPDPATTPTPVQVAQINRKYGMFCHFSINTFNDMEWSDGTLPASSFNPTAVDADSWVLAAKAAGMNYLILTTKHHDGFCLWDSAYTTYDVASSPKPADVVKLVSDACARHGLKFAVYYSLWDRHEAAYKDADPHVYIEYMKHQLTELLTHYGPVCEIWFDGAWDRPAENWYIPEVYDHIKSLQPECLVTINRAIGTPGTGLGAGDIDAAVQKQGDPIRYFPCDFRTVDPQMPAFPDPKVFSRGAQSYYMPFEGTVTLAPTDQWFYHPSDTGSKPLGDLERYFNTATAQDNILVFNCPPDRGGHLLASNVTALKSLAQRLGLEPGRPIPANLAYEAVATSTNSIWQDGTDRWQAKYAFDNDPNSRWGSTNEGAATATLEADFETPVTFDRVIINEYLEGGAGRCQGFVLEAWDGTAWQIFYTGTTIGESLRADFTPVTTAKFRLRMTAASASVSIWGIKLQNSAR
ncbi:MAG: crotonobetainyl-CoA--carnitine CoA-transferase, partial [Akkermansiaceae bacterium]|nr:crotonobetainyl-CoA--carnitine CoA-transferase [Akkermansiaceae bacterium]